MINISLTAPLPIPSRRYANQERQTSCIQCPGGSASEEGAFECGNCFAGTIESGSGTCTNCPSGRFSKAKSSVCDPCEQGKSSSSGDPICTPCVPGTYRENVNASTGNHSGECIACVAGKYSGTQASVCIPCAAGQYLASTNGSQCKVRTYVDKNVYGEISPGLCYLLLRSQIST